MKITFKFVVLCFAIKFTILQGLKYFKNNDSSVLTYKKFAENPKTYPTFTFCFSDDPTTIYTSKVEELYVSQKEFSSLLKGSSSTIERAQEKLNRIVESESDKLTLQTQSIVSNISFKMKDQNETATYNHERYDEDKIEKVNAFLNRKNVDPDNLCFTRKSYDGKKSPRISDEVSLDLNVLGGSLLSDSGIIRFYIHLPGQLKRNFGKPNYEVRLDKKVHNSQRFEVSIDLQYVSVLRKRFDANKKCDAMNENDDKYFNKMVIEEIECIPTYWKLDFLKDAPFHLCNTSSQLQRAYALIKNSSDVFSKYDEPCDEFLSVMKIVRTSIAGKETNGMVLKVSYQTETFQNVQNVRDFDFESFFSGTGGYVGIFLGYSMLQIPELMDVDWIKCWENIKLMCDMTGFIALVISCFDFQRKFIICDFKNEKRY